MMNILSINASQVELSTEMMKRLPAFFQTAFIVLQNIYVLIPACLFVLCFLIWIFINKDFSHITKRKERNEHERLSKIAEYLEKHPNSAESHITIFKDVCDAYYFKLATGIYAENKFREALVKFKVDAGYPITWTTIRRALPFIILQGEDVVVRKYNNEDFIGKWVNLLMAISFALIALMCGVAILGSGVKTFTSFLLFATLPTLFFMLSLFSFSQNRDRDAAEKMKISLKRIDESQKQNISETVIQ